MSDERAELSSLARSKLTSVRLALYFVTIADRQNQTVKLPAPMLFA